MECVDLLLTFFCAKGKQSIFLTSWRRAVYNVRFVRNRLFNHWPIQNIFWCLSSRMTPSSRMSLDRESIWFLWQPAGSPGLKKSANIHQTAQSSPKALKKKCQKIFIYLADWGSSMQMENGRQLDWITFWPAPGNGRGNAVGLLAWWKHVHLFVAGRDNGLLNWPTQSIGRWFGCRPENNKAFSTSRFYSPRLYDLSEAAGKYMTAYQDSVFFIYRNGKSFWRCIHTRIWNKTLMRSTRIKLTLTKGITLSCSIVLQLQSQGESKPRKTPLTSCSNGRLHVSYYFIIDHVSPAQNTSRFICFTQHTKAYHSPH